MAILIFKNSHKIKLFFFSPTLSQCHCEMALVKTQNYVCYDTKIPVP